MKRKLTAATAIALVAASAVAAQTGTGETANLGSTWEQETVRALFNEDDAVTLRSESEIQSNWEGLSAAEQAQVRADCAIVMADARMDGAAGAMDAEGPATGTPASDTDAADAGGPEVPTDSLEAETEETTTADGGVAEIPGTGAAAGAEGGTGAEAGADADTGLSGSEGTEDEGSGDLESDGEVGGATGTSADAAVSLDVAQSDWRKLCEIIDAADNM